MIICFLLSEQEQQEDSLKYQDSHTKILRNNLYIDSLDKNDIIEFKNNYFLKEYEKILKVLLIYMRMVV